MGVPSYIFAGLGAGDFDGAFVKSAEVMGGSLTLTLQLADGSEMLLPFSPAVAAGSGNNVYVASATYDASTGHIELTIPTPPSDIEIGDIISFQVPSNVDTATDNLQISVVDPVESGSLFDTDFVEARAIDLTASRFVMILRVARGFVFMNALHLEQIVPIQRVQRTITNAELKTIDTDYIELIPAPGAGKTIKVEAIRTTHMGSDRPTYTAAIDPLWLRAWMLYGFITDDTDPMPFDFSAPLEVSGSIQIVDGNRSFTGGLHAADGSVFKKCYGTQSLIEDTALVMGLGINGGGNPPDPSIYTEALFDQFMSTANDNTMVVDIDYYISEF